MDKLVSIIIPNYNHSKYLDNRIQSILCQTYQEFEIIILDDCSSDNSKEIIEAYRDNPKVTQIIYNTVNSGSPFKQWKKGIQLAKGSIIWIAESDDSCEPNILEELLKRYLSSNAVLAFARSRVIDQNDNELFFDFQDDLKSDISLDGHSFIQQYLVYKNVVCNASGAIFSKEAALRIDDSYMTFKGSGDWLFWINLVTQGNVEFINRSLNYFRVQGQNATLKVIKSGLAKIENKRIYDYLLDESIIDDVLYTKLRDREIKKIYFSHLYDKETRNNLLQCWHVSKLYHIKLWLTDLFIRIKK